VAVLAAALVVAMAGPAFAIHDHFVETPNGECHQVAQGQTSKGPGDGGYHRFHDNVHLGATDDNGEVDSPLFLGKGHSPVKVWKEDTAGPQIPPLPPACS